MNEPSTSSVFTNDYIENAVPSEWKYKIRNKVVFGTPPKLEVSLKVALFSQEDIETWVEALEKKTQCNYSILHTRKTAGEKVLFKRYLSCHHRTRLKVRYPHGKNGTKNTNCPSKLNISLMKITDRYQEKGKIPPDPKMPCVIDYVITHNHSASLAAKFRKVASSVNKNIMELFAAGHSGSTAYETIRNAVPSEWKYKVLNKVVYGSPPKLEVCLKVALFSQQDIQLWVEALEDKTDSSYSIQMTKKTTGEKVVFKRRLHCRHKTKLNKTYPDPKSGTRNTNCPSRLSITLMKVKKKKPRGKYPPDPEMPCIIDYVITHNHSASLAARYRKVTRASNDNLAKLFSVGHSASTAYEVLRIDVQLKNPSNYDELLVNRSVCPDRNYCHKWYNEFKKQNGAIDCKDKSFISKRLQDYNAKMGEECAKIEINNEDYVIVLCPPLFKRVHQYIKSAAEVVFMAAINPADYDGSKAFFLMTHSDCGALPLGVIITGSENTELIATGLKLLQNIMGDSIFYGRKEGPQIFIVDDCEAEQIAINSIWSEPIILFCSLHILHSLWRYLLCTKNGIDREKTISFFKQFRLIAYANTVDECNRYYNEAMLAAIEHPNYLQVLEAYWEKRDMWTNCYKNCLTTNLKINSLETSMCLLKEPIFHRMRPFNVVQLVDFILTRFVDFYTERLLDAANGRLIRDLSRKVPLPPDIKNVEQVNSYLYLVPSIKLSHVRYYVNVDIAACTCLKNSTGYICNHIGWLLTMFPSYQEKIEDPKTREIFQKTASGQELPLEKTETKEEIESEENNSMDEAENIEEQLIVAGNEIIKLEIVKEEATEIMNKLNVSIVPPVILSVLTEEVALQAGEQITEKICTTFSDFLRKAPSSVTPALKQMLYTTKKIASIQEFVSACTNVYKGDLSS